MSIFEYNEELHRKSLLEEGREEGRQEGITQIICHMLGKSQSPETISDLTGEPLDTIYEVQEQHAQTLREKTLYERK